MKKPLSLYLHFPFCVQKCRYCDFLSFPADASAREAYLGRLIEEIAKRGPAYKDYEVQTIFIGGGTPSLMESRQMTQLLAALYQYFQIHPQAEITVECNPGTVYPEKLAAYRKAGVNRLSFGLQSTNDEELRYLGRIHTMQQFLDNYQAARKSGFDNINIDLMSALPGQTVSSYKETLQRVLALAPEHISAYSLIIEEGTPFASLYGTDEKCHHIRSTQSVWPLPDEDSEREMYHLTRALLAKDGYERYEISNYAKKGYECRHNLTYWYRGDYLGLGLGAASLVDNVRFSNSCEMQLYMQHFKYVDPEVLDMKAQMEETMFLGLRCTKGISIREFEKTFGKSLMSVYGDIVNKYIACDLLAYDCTHERIGLTDAGLDVSNSIMAEFLLD